MSLTRKIVLAAGVLVLAITGYVSYTMLTASSLSPAAEVAHEQEGISIKIEYCRPSKRDRLIFGTPDEGALQPYGNYWRLGANDATKLTLGSDVKFGGQPLKKGSYSLYAFPDEDHWVIGINTEADRSGSEPPDFSKDVGRIKIPVIETSESQEQFTISISESGSNALVNIHWDRTSVEIPVEKVNQ
jgi:hypothetical protein